MLFSAEINLFIQLIIIDGDIKHDERIIEHYEGRDLEGHIYGVQPENKWEQTDRDYYHAVRSGNDNNKAKQIYFIILIGILPLLAILLYRKLGQPVNFIAFWYFISKYYRKAFAVSIIVAVSFFILSFSLLFVFGGGWTNNELIEHNTYILFTAIFKSVFTFLAFKISRMFNEFALARLLGSALLIMDGLYYLLLFFAMSMGSGPAFG